MIKKHYEQILKDFDDEDENKHEFGYLFREEHIQYMENALFNLGSSIRWYDCGHPWVIYWVINALSVL